MTVEVADHNPHCKDADGKSKEKSWMQRLKSFRHDGINKHIDYIEMNVF